MRKVKIASLLFVSMFALFTAVLSVNSVNATVVTCPAGYVCTPLNQSAVACPAGYICEPIRTTQTQPVITSLTYKQDKDNGTEIKWCYNLTKNLG
jgi:hypothetical protein